MTEVDGVAGRLRAAMLDGGDSGDGTIAAVLAEQVSFFSPATDEPVSGRAVVAAVLATARSIYQGLVFTDLVGGGDRAALFFEARVAGRPLQGCYSVHGDGSGEIARIDALFRPADAAQVLVEAMMQRLAAGSEAVR